MISAKTTDMGNIKQIILLLKHTAYYDLYI